MHHCLYISEIVSTIMDFTMGKGNEGTVANFAIACRAFQEAALDVLWRAHFTLEPLIKCMPDDLWEVVYSNVEEPRLVQTIVYFAIYRLLTLRFAAFSSTNGGDRLYEMEILRSPDTLFGVRTP
jgi:hypothetical protein